MSLYQTLCKCNLDGTLSFLADINFTRFCFDFVDVRTPRELFVSEKHVVSKNARLRGRISSCEVDDGEGQILDHNAAFPTIYF